MKSVCLRRRVPARLCGIVCSMLSLLSAACYVYDRNATREHANSVYAQTAPVGDASVGPACRTDLTPDAACPVACASRCIGSDDACDDVVDASATVSCSVAHAYSVCSGGACVLARCRDGYRDCDQRADNGCETAADDVEHCGQCLHRCEVEHGSPRCEAGRCEIAACEPGYGDCDGDAAACETRLDSADNCGACGARCTRLAYADARCEAGRCRVETCDQGHADCDGDPTNGCEQSLDTLSACGACDVPCDKASCSGGVCTAVDCAKQPGRADCDGDELTCEVDVSSDVDHCGSCEHACRFSVELPHAQLACSEGSCKAVCEQGFGDCDGRFDNGCEQALGTDSNCGACAHACQLSHAQAHCVDGSCELVACDKDYADCDADEQSCESSLLDVASCGACTVRCELPHAQTRCENATGTATCEIAQCADGWSDCDGEPENGCERDTRRVSAGGAGPCYPDASCSSASLGDHHFYFCNRSRTWQDARRVCRRQLNGDLATLSDKKTRAFLRKRLSTSVWIGHNDLAVSGVWVWANTGVPFWQGGRAGHAIGGAFSSWDSGEPNHSGDCGALLVSGNMDDQTCSQAQPFVCEVSPDLCPEDPAKSNPGQCGCGVADVDADGDGFAECPG